MISIQYVGNATQLDEGGMPYKHQTRYEDIGKGWLRRRYEVWDETGPVITREWVAVRKKPTPDTKRWLVVEGGIVSAPEKLPVGKEVEP
jgi:hypothetical protein